MKIFFWDSTLTINHLLLNYPLWFFRLVDSLSVIVIFVVMSFIGVSLLTVIPVLYSQKKITVFEGYRLAWKGWARYHKVMLLYIFKVFVWSCVFILPGIWVAIQYFYSVFLGMSCDLSAKEALQTSRALIKGRLNDFLDFHLIFGGSLAVHVFLTIYGLDYLMLNLQLMKWNFCVGLVTLSEYVLVLFAIFAWMVFNFQFYQYAMKKIGEK